MNKSEYMRAYRQRPQIKAREKARKSTPEYKAKKAKYMRWYKAWNRVPLSVYEQARQAAQRQRKMIAEGTFGDLAVARTTLFDE
jgi:hypothetical protein